MASLTRTGFVLLVAVLAAACGSTSSTGSSTTTPFNVLIDVGETGATSATNIACTYGLKAAALVINGQGGIMGRKVSITTYDTQGNATQGVNLLNQALNSNQTWNFAFAGGSSDEALAQMPTINNAKIISMASASSPQLGDPTKAPYHFQTGVSPDLVDKYLVDYVAAQHYKKVGLFTYDGAFGQSQNLYIAKYLTAAGVPFVNMPFSASAIDLSPQLLQLQGTGVDAVVWSALGAQIGYVIKSRAKIGWNVPFIGDTAVSSGDVYTLAGNPSFLNNVVEQVWTVDVAKPASQRPPAFTTFFNAVQQIVPVFALVLHQYGACYDELQLMKAVVEQIKSFDPDKIRAALENGFKPPADRLAVFPQGWGWTATSHAPVNTPDQFTVTPVSQLKDGQYTGA